MKLILKGVVTLGDDCRCDPFLKDGAVWIGDKDVLKEIDDAEFTGKVIVGIADQTFDGKLFIDFGWGYSEFTPMDSDELRVGEHNLIKELSKYEGQEITMYVSDEPINLLE